MNERLCLIERGERGDRIRAVRLVGQHADAVWTSPRVEGCYAADAAEDAQAAAEWIAERLGVDGDTLGLLVVDTAGSQCAWVQAASADAGAVRGAYGRGGELPEEDFSDLGLEDEPEQGGVFGSRPTPLEASIEPLGPAYESDTGVRVGVLVAPDAIVRLLIDALDRQGVDFQGATSLWHALGWAAAPTADESTSSRVVADSPTVSGGVLIQPDGRLVWAWCREGALLAAGSQRLSLHDDGPIVMKHDVARLVNDWVAWSAQVGVAPGRILVVACPLAWEKSTGDPDTLSAPGVASAISELWPEAVLDVDVHDDPTLEVMRRAHESERDSLEPGHTLGQLATRPGRASRRVYQLLGLALVAGGIALAALGYRWQSQVAGVQANASELRQAYTAEIELIEEDLGKPGVITGDRLPMLALVREVDQATRSSQVTRPPGKPVIKEIETLSFLLGELGDRVELQKIDAGTQAITVEMTTEDAGVLDRIISLIDDLSMNDGAVRWLANQQQRGSRYNVTMVGRWQRGGGQP